MGNKVEKSIDIKTSHKSYCEETKKEDKDTWGFIQLNEKRLIGRKLREVQVFLMESGIPYRTFSNEELKNLTGEKKDFRINLEIKNGFVVNAFPDSFIVVEIMYSQL